jgi:hypothetical protein
MFQILNRSCFIAHFQNISNPQILNRYGLIALYLRVSKTRNIFSSIAFHVKMKLRSGVHDSVKVNQLSQIINLCYEITV